MFGLKKRVIRLEKDLFILEKALKDERSKLNNIYISLSKALIRIKKVEAKQFKTDNDIVGMDILFKIDHSVFKALMEYLKLDAEINPKKLQNNEKESVRIIKLKK